MIKCVRLLIILLFVIIGSYGFPIDDSDEEPDMGDMKVLSYKSPDKSYRWELGRPGNSVIGSYSVSLANGKLGTVYYIADKEGFRVYSTDIPGIPSLNKTSPAIAPISSVNQ